MADNECRVYFAFYGDGFDPEEITRFIGIEPTSTKLKGEKASGYVPKNSSWTLSTDNVSGERADVYELASEIVSQLQPKKDLIIKAMERFNALSKLQVVLFLSMKEEVSTPAIGFDISTTKFLGEIGAFIDIDTYKH